MTAPRRNLPGECFIVRRFTIEDEHYLQPDAGSSAIVPYAIARYAQLYEQTVCLVVQWADGYIAVFVDNAGERSEFYRQCHGLLGRQLRKKFGLPAHHHLWENGRPEDRVLLDEAAEIAALLECCDAVLESRVDHIFDSPFLVFGPDQWGVEQTFTRPPGVDESLPETVTIVPMPPTQLQRRGVDEARRIVKRRIAQRAKFHQDRRYAPKEKQQRRVVRREDLEAPKSVMVNATRHTLQTLESRERKPWKRYAGADNLVARAEVEYEEFLKKYQKALRRLKDRGPRSAVFPPGTVFWRRVANASVESTRQRATA